MPSEAGNLAGFGSLVQWLGKPNACVFTVAASGTHPPAHLLSDEKFASLEGEQIYLFLVAQSELIWHTELMEVHG